MPGANQLSYLKYSICVGHRIMFDEAAEDLIELDAGDALIHNEWRLGHMRRVEAVLWENPQSESPELQRAKVGQALSPANPDAPPQNPPQPEQSKPASKSSASF